MAQYGYYYMIRYIILLNYYKYNIPIYPIYLIIHIGKIGKIVKYATHMRDGF